MHGLPALGQPFGRTSCMPFEENVLLLEAAHQCFREMSSLRPSRGKIPASAISLSRGCCAKT